jgi:hypothetical protein
LTKAATKLKTKNYTSCPGTNTALLPAWSPKGSQVIAPGHFYFQGDTMKELTRFEQEPHIKVKSGGQVK